MASVAATGAVFDTDFLKIYHNFFAAPKKIPVTSLIDLIELKNGDVYNYHILCVGST